MRTPGSAAVLEHRRRLAIARLNDGYDPAEVADFLGVDPATVRRWRQVYRRDGDAGLVVRAPAGRPPKLTADQERAVAGWIADPATGHGFPTDLWTGRRLADRIRREWGIGFNPRYLADWLGRRAFTPQKPRRAPRERDPQKIAAWLAADWPRIKKTPAGWGRT
jgi:transposase